MNYLARLFYFQFQMPFGMCMCVWVSVLCVCRSLDFAHVRSYSRSSHITISIQCKRLSIVISYYKTHTNLLNTQMHFYFIYFVFEIKCYFQNGCARCNQVNIVNRMKKDTEEWENCMKKWDTIYETSRKKCSGMKTCNAVNNVCCVSYRNLLGNKHNISIDF